MKILSKLEIEGNSLDLIKKKIATHTPKNPTSSITLNDEKLRAFPVRSGQGKGVSFHKCFSTLYWKS